MKKTKQDQETVQHISAQSVKILDSLLYNYANPTTKDSMS